MTSGPHHHDRELIVGITPGSRPDGRLVVGLCRAGALGVLDLGTDPGRALTEAALVEARHTGPFGVRVTPLAGLGPGELPGVADTVIVTDPSLVRPHREPGRRVLAEVFSLPEALAAAAAIAGGARGVVLDAQLALARESTLPTAVRTAIAAMDGSETGVVGGHRLYTRPDLPAPALDATAGDIAGRLGADDLHDDLVPVGQDGSFAAALANRHKTAGGIVQAVRAAIDHQLAAARELRPLDPGAGTAATRGTAYPVAQGPKTRVSDRSAFAAAVAEGGGLPFLALSLMRGDEIRDLLAEAAAVVGDRPCGVGILGFVPPELRDEAGSTSSTWPRASRSPSGGGGSTAPSGACSRSSRPSSPAPTTW